MAPNSNSFKARVKQHRSFLEFDYLSYIHNSVLMRGGGVGTASRAGF